jgi:WD40 repeat protein
MELNNNFMRQNTSLLLTASLDWTIKLWSLSYNSNSNHGSLKQDQSSQASADHHIKRDFVPLCEFISPSYDYISDVHWRPKSSSIFATITSSGLVVLWNICKSISEPVETLQITNTYINSATTNNHTQQPHSALNKFAWSSDGRMILVGDSRGIVHLVEINESTSTSSDEKKMESIFKDLYKLAA